jgi:hypothetical protein
MHLEEQKAQFGLLVPPHIEHSLREVYSQIEMRVSCVISASTSRSTMRVYLARERAIRREN